MKLVLGVHQGNKTWSLWDAFVLNRCTEHLLLSADITHALFQIQRETPPGGDKGKGSSGGEENHVPYPSLRSRLMFSSSILHPLHPFWFEPDSCFWSAALHITGRKWARCISQDVKGEKWRKTPPSLYNPLEMGGENWGKNTAKQSENKYKK